MRISDWSSDVCSSDLTLFDVIQLKAARSATLAERVRMQQVGFSLIALGQGIPFFHAGQDILRSKSMDRDSFNDGRSEERRVGKECVGTCGSRCAPDHRKKNTTQRPCSTN